MNSVIVHIIALVLYVVSAVFYGANLALRAPSHLRAARGLLIAGIVVHALAIGDFCVEIRQSPFASSYGTLSVAAWALALLCLPTELLQRLPALGAPAVPVCALLLFAAVGRSHVAISGLPAVRSSLTSLHVLLILFSFALFALAACCALFYAWQYRLLKHPNRRGMFRRLPPLETLDQLAFHCVAFALPLLTIGLALGMTRAAYGELPGNWLLDLHTLLSLVTWAVYGFYLFARLAAGWRGARLNYLLLAGLLLIIALFFIPSTTHRFV